MEKIPHKTTLDIAKERLKSFMDNGKVSLKDCAKIMGLRDEKPLKQLLKAKGSHTHAHMVMAEFGSSGIQNAVSKLNEMRNPTPKQNAPVDRCAEPEETETIQQLARRMYDLYRKGQACKVGLSNTVEMMNARKPAFVSRSFTTKTLCTVLSPSILDKMSTKWAEDILYTLACLNWTNYPPELKDYQIQAESQKVSDTSESVKSKSDAVSDINKTKKPKATKPAYLPSSIQVKALASIDAYTQAHNYPDCVASKSLGFSGGNISQIRMAFKNKTLGEKAARRLVEKIKAFSPVCMEEAESTLAAKEHAQESPKPISVDTEASHQDVNQIVHRQHQIEDIIERLQSNPQFRKVFMQNVREMAELRVEQELNVSIEALREVAPMVDILIAAKRNNVRVQLVVG